MSGATVILGSWTNDFVDGSVRAISDKPATNFIGIYSGRPGALTAEAQIGMVWHGTYVRVIIAGNLRDSD
jgi:hypothetical protein